LGPFLTHSTSSKHRQFNLDKNQLGSSKLIQLLTTELIRLTSRLSPPPRRRLLLPPLRLRSHGKRFRSFHRLRASPRSSFRKLTLMTSQHQWRKCKSNPPWMSRLETDSSYRSRLSRSQRMPISFRSSPQWKKPSRKLPRRPTDRELLSLEELMASPFHRAKSPFRARPSKSLRDNKMLSSRLSSTNWIWKRSKGRLKLNRMRNLKIRLLWPNMKDNKKRSSHMKELLNLRNCKRKKQLKNWKLREWNKSSLPPRLSRRPRQLLPRRLLLRLTLPD
jgi:hypothetical protein